MITIAAGRLEGTGTIAADVSNSGTIAPGLSPGSLAIAGDLTLTSTSLIQIEIGGATQGTQYDLLSETGTVALTLQGTLALNLINGFTPDLQTFTVLDSNQTLLGAFSNVASGGRLTTNDGLGSFQVNYGAGSAFDPTDVVLSDFLAVPEPSTAGLLAIATIGMLGFRRKGN